MRVGKTWRSRRRWCLDGGAVYVGDGRRSRKELVWMAGPCMLGTEGGAGKNWSKKVWSKAVDEVSKAFAEAEPQKLGLDGGAVRVGKTWRPQELGLDGGAVRVGKT